MTFDLERAALQGRLAEARDRADGLRLKCLARIRSIRMDLHPDLQTLDTMDIPGAADQMDELVAIWGDYIAALADIDRLKKAVA